MDGVFLLCPFQAAAQSESHDFLRFAWEVGNEKENHDFLGGAQNQKHTPNCSFARVGFGLVAVQEVKDDALALHECTRRLASRDSRDVELRRPVFCRNDRAMAKVNK